MRFINRSDEVRKIEALWTNTRGPLLALLYGRRRVGKSHLLSQVFAGKRGVRFIATQATSPVILRAFLEESSSQLGDPDLTIANYPNWRVALRYFLEAAKTERLYLIFDEFGYLVRADKEAASIIQALWTQYAGKSKLRLILCGSQVQLLASLREEGRPLFGNIEYSKLIEPLSYRDAAAFAPKWSDRDRLMLYGCLGGSGRYLDLVDDADSLEKNLTNMILDDGPLHDEGTLLLTMEDGIHDYAIYHAALVAIAGGATQWGEIINQSGVTSGKLQKVLDTLVALRLVRHDLAFGDKSRGTFIIADTFLRSLYRLVEPHTTNRQLLNPSVYWH